MYRVGFRCFLLQCVARSFWPLPDWAEVTRLYTGTLIQDIFALVERVEKVATSAKRAATSSRASRPLGFSCPSRGSLISQSEQLSQPLRLSPADWNLALFLIVHAQL